MLNNLNEIISKKSTSDKKIELNYINELNQSLAAFKGEISSFSQSITSGVSVRVINGEKMGLAFTEKVNEKEIENCIDNAIENSKFMPDDPYNAIYESDEKKESNKYFDEKSRNVALNTKKEMVLKLEKMCYEMDKRVVNVFQSALETQEYEYIITNSYSLNKKGKNSIYYGFVYLIVSDGKDTQTSMYFKGSKSIYDLNLEEIAKKAVEKGLELLSASFVESGKYPVILSNEVASSLFSAFLPIVYADEIQKGKSKLGNKIGEKVGSDLLTIIDDPHKNGLQLMDFDIEGVDTEVVKIFDRGVFLNPLYNIYTAKKENKKSNGRASKHGLASSINVSAINPFIENGDNSLEDLFNNLNRGIYITNVEGLHAGIDRVSGDFSLAAKGFLIENGKKGIPIKNFTVAGNFYDFIKMIRSTANDRRIDNYVPFSSPSILVEDLSISGK